jgi:hypothetical protein
MENQKPSMTCRTASGGSESFSRLSHGDQKITERVQIRDCSYNAGSHYPFNVHAPLKQRLGIWALMRKGQCRKLAKDRYIDSSYTNNFWHVVWVYCFRRLGLIGHR